MRLILEWEGDNVRRASDRAIKRNLMRSGAYVRTTMRRGLKRRRRISRPGEKPSIHTHGLNSLRNIRFGWDESTQTVVVGPVKFGSGTGVPAALEHGGRAVSKRKDRRRIIKTIRRPRPYAFPALRETSDKLTERFWKDSIE